MNDRLRLTVLGTGYLASPTPPAWPASGSTSSAWTPTLGR
jgi:hypothetical protein